MLSIAMRGFGGKFPSKKPLDAFDVSSNHRKNHQEMTSVENACITSSLIPFPIPKPQPPMMLLDDQLDSATEVPLQFHDVS